MTPSSNGSVWLIAADMGYGHVRAIYPLRDLGREGMTILGQNDGAAPSEVKSWQRLASIYERFSRARRIPVIGKPLFGILNALMYIPSFYPARNLSHSTAGVHFLESSIRKGLCAGIINKVRQEPLPLVTSFYAPAIAAAMAGIPNIYCILCDADLNRIWVAKEPSESRIIYLAPCGKAAHRLRSYGVTEERIVLTGFPLPEELLGGRDLPVLKHDLGQRLHYLDPKNRFWPLHSREAEHFLGQENCTPRKDRILTLTYAVGGAGAQTEVGGTIAISLRYKLAERALRLNLVAGVKRPVREYFEKILGIIGPEAAAQVSIIHGDSMPEYLARFSDILHTTDILWTKPSELSFYCALGIPILTAPTLGAQEYFNRQWLREIQAAVQQENPDYTHQWLFDFLDDGRFAEAAWSGFLKARKLGTYKIREILREGKIASEDSPLLR